MQLGLAVAGVLAGAWRAEPPPVDPAAVDPLLAHLLATGAAGLAGWKLRTPGVPADARRHYVLAAAQHDERLRGALDLCAGAGIEPLLIKGWDVARRYPTKGLRPFGDLDFLFRPGHAAAARALFPEGNASLVDLHHKHVTASRIPVDDLFARSRTVEAVGREVRVLCPEHDLHLLAVHFLSSGGGRPLSLCDVAMAVETRRAGFDWDVALGTDARRHSWTLTALGLARDLLGADVAGTPAERHAVPRWVTEHVLEGFARRPGEGQLDPLQLSLDPRRLAAALAERWPPDPLRTNVLRGGRVRDHRPLHLQAFDYVARATSSARR